MLPGARGLSGPLGCLAEARYGIVFGAIGAARDCLETALDYAGTREQFGRPIAGFQLTQRKLADMAVALGNGHLLALHLGRLKDAGALTTQQVSLGKFNNVRDGAARSPARPGRSSGGNGITLEYPVIRHMVNLESVYTYEGTHEIHTLVDRPGAHRDRRVPMSDAPTGAARRHAGRRLQPRAGRPLRHDDARRPRRGGHQGGAPAAAATTPGRWGPPHAAGRDVHVLPVGQPEQDARCWLDLADPTDRAEARELAASADVAGRELPPRDDGRFGLGYDELAASANPGVVYASISGFGSGAGARMPGYDLLVQAMGGLMSITGPAPDQPTKVGVALVDVLTGLHATVGILAALHERDRSGAASTSR